MAELKPCPFCGSEIIEYDGTYVFGAWYVRCCRCGVNLPPFHTKEEAIKAWNTRTKKDGE